MKCHRELTEVSALYRKSAEFALELGVGWAEQGLDSGLSTEHLTGRFSCKCLTPNLNINFVYFS